MAFIKIRGRREPVEIDNERARQVKARKFGTDTIEKADPREDLDLGDVWSGEYGQVIGIELTPVKKPQKSKQEEYQEEERKRIEAWNKLTPTQKGKHLGRFKFIFASRSGNYRQDPPTSILKEAEKIQTTYYKKHPKALECPRAEYEELLPTALEGASLAASKSVDADKENGLVCQNPKCGKKLTGNLKKYCSGDCMNAVS